MTINIVIAIFPGVTHLDFTGPHQFFSRLPDATVTVASPRGEDIEADGLGFARLASLADIHSCDVLCVPGGYGVSEMIHQADFIAHVARLGKDARYISSVCTGSIILAAAGLLKGKRAACHWAWRHLLARFPDVEVVDERVVRDGKVFTGGGVTAGIDMALSLIAEIAGPQTTQTIQLALEYAPAPPFAAGSPSTAPADLVEKVSARIKQQSDSEQRIREFLGT